jgi:hypothetical protein
MKYARILVQASALAGLAIASAACVDADPLPLPRSSRGTTGDREQRDDQNQGGVEVGGAREESAETPSGGSETLDNCDVMARKIRSAAIQRGYDGNGDGQPDGQDVCASTNPTIQKDFARACASLRECTGG